MAPRTNQKNKTREALLAWVDVDSRGVIERLTESARAAGFDLLKSAPSLASVFRVRWTVAPIG